MTNLCHWALGKTNFFHTSLSAGNAQANLNLKRNHGDHNFFVHNNTKNNLLLHKNPKPFVHRILLSVCVLSITLHPVNQTTCTLFVKLNAGFE